MSYIWIMNKQTGLYLLILGLSLILFFIRKYWWRVRTKVAELDINR